MSENYLGGGGGAKPIIKYELYWYARASALKHSFMPQNNVAISEWTNAEPIIMIVYIVNSVMIV